MKIVIPIFIGIVLGSFIGAKVVSFVENKKSEPEWRIEIVEAELAECQRSSEVYNEFKSAMRNVIAEPYDSEFNTCYDHSKAVQKAFAEIGIESSIFISKDRDHAWIAPWIEATTGQFIAPGRYGVLEVRDINLEVICD